MGVGLTFMPHAKRSPGRLSAFSDGVFAVLITVLVLELRPPDIPTFKALLSLWPTWLSYAVSYLFIAIVWANHSVPVEACKTLEKEQLGGWDNEAGR